MKKQWYNIYMECVKESPSITSKLGDKSLVGKIKSEGLAYVTCQTVQKSVGEYFKVYYK